MKKRLAGLYLICAVDQPQVKQFLAHPRGGKLLALTDGKLLLVDRGGP